jgi:undecaprenyl-diphosphatase
MTTLELQLFDWVHGLAGTSAWLDAMARLLATDYFVLVSLSLFMVGLWFAGRTAQQRRRYQRIVLAAPFAMVLANLLVIASNETRIPPDRLRPFQNDPQVLASVEDLFYPAPDPSFPSNSAAVAFALAGLLVRANRRVASLGGTLAVGLVLARVYVGVHYPLDVVAGAAIGLVAGLVAWRLLAWIEPLPTHLLRLARRVYLA